MGSLSQFILHDSVKPPLDEAFSRALEAGQWGNYLDDCHFYLLKAKQETVPISHEGAMKVIQFYYNQIISSSDDDALVLKGVDVLEHIVELCKSRRSSEEQSWHEKVAASLLPSHLLQPCLMHRLKDVRIFGAQQVLEMLEETGAKAILDCPEIVIAVIKLLDKGLTKDSCEAKKILVTLSTSSEGLSALFSDSQNQETFKSVASTSDMARFNVYEVMQKVAIHGTENLSVVSNSGWLDQLITEACSDDVLNRLAALQLLTDMVSDDRALQHLSRAGVLGSLQTALVEAQNEDDCSTAMTLPGLLKLFGELGNKHPEQLIHQHGPAMNAIFHLAASPDNTMMIIAVDTIAHVAMSLNGKQLLQSFHKTETHKVLENIGERIRNAPVEIRNRLLEAITIFFQSSDSSCDRVEKDEVNEILQDWYATLFPCKTITPIFRMLKLPFSDFRPYVYRMLLELVKTAWGLKLIATCDSMLEFIIKRSSESDKLGKELKFELIKQLVLQNDVVNEICGEKTMKKLNEYHTQGPFYVEPFNDDVDMVGIPR